MKKFYYKNIGLQHFKYADVNNFTSNTGLKIRRLINRPFRAAMKLATPGRIVVEDCPKLDKGRSYIFAATHSFVDEITTLLSVIDRSVYALCGSTNQIESNPKFYAQWMGGFIYVDRYNEKNRKESLPKMKRIIDGGSSILLFPEGAWNNSENLLMLKIFSGVYTLAKITGAKVVPIRCYREYGKKNIYVKASYPIDLGKMNREESLIMLRDTLATLMYEAIENYSTPIKRQELPKNARLLFLNERKEEYLKTPWTRDVWNEELTVYKDKQNPLPNEVRASFDNVKVDYNNISLIAPIWSDREDDIRYDFLKYMKENWNK